MKVLIVLGSPNSETGDLGQVALDRLKYCLDIFESKDNCIICTGGFGEHFNTAPLPHANYAVKYLKEKGLSAENFLECALSANTVEDAVVSKKIVLNHNLNSVVVITSDYHVERVKLIFDEILGFDQIEYVGVTHDISDSEKKKLLEHEKKAINAILSKGLYY
ncbi:YdcF family protein [Flavobacterium sp. UGB4466]|uniref:YdcF family protein n=1 Tax=Flavobacterium sp. UGB4466 TaxID=2730889 RepID=UPI00192B42F8|nr:YdcF family protein [Flavobacterium sp. UGB4466]